MGKKLLIGGQALSLLGSSRTTFDTDYLVNIIDDTNAFIFDRENNIDYINANGNKFFDEIWKLESANETGIASVKALLELKAYSFIQHLLNRNFQKADDAEYDIKFLIRLFGGLYACPIAKKYISRVEYDELSKVIRSVKF